MTAPAQDTAAYWNVRSPEFDAVHARLRLIGRLAAALHGVRSVLDVGCGPAALRGVLPPAAEYFGVDVASTVIEAQRDPAHFEVVNLDRSPRPFGGRRFDLLICSGVFEYVNDRDGFMRFLDAAAAPNGWLIFSFTNHQHVRDGLRWVRGDYAGYRDPHVNFMLIPEVARLLGRWGWRVATRRSITMAGREHPLLKRFVRFPLNVANRQYLFVCRRGSAAGGARGAA